MTRSHVQTALAPYEQRDVNEGVLQRRDKYDVVNVGTSEGGPQRAYQW